MQESNSPAEVRSQEPASCQSNLRVAIVHYWFTNFGGGDRVVEELAELFPQADLFTLFMDPDQLPPKLRSRPVRCSCLQKVPGILRHYPKLLPIFPVILEQFQLDDYDLIISSESGPAKGVLTRAGSYHICYCETPMRYLWDMYHLYRKPGQRNTLSAVLLALGAHYLRLWDLATAARVDCFVANSFNVAARIQKHYRRDATVIYPPVAVASGYIADQVEDYYLVVSRLVDYKRVDLAIEACNRLKRPLRVVGDGVEYKRLRRLAGPTVSFLGFLPDEELHRQYAHCRALLFPGEEDFGIVPVEAQSFGRPVIAYGRGGALETIDGVFPGQPIDGRTGTGIFFPEQSVESLVHAMQWFEAAEACFSPSFIQSRTKRFGRERFQRAMRALISEKLAAFRAQPRLAAGPDTDRMPADPPQAERTKSAV
jgi:glycosyltransferase involved in cell wall biosynthesis